jgi:hypothetical protein
MALEFTIEDDDFTPPPPPKTRPNWRREINELVDAGHAGRWVSFPDQWRSSATNIRRQYRVEASVSVNGYDKPNKGTLHILVPQAKVPSKPIPDKREEVTA